MSQNELQRLTQVHLKVMDYCLLGFSRNDIATTMGMSPEGIGLIINSPLFQDEFAKKRQIQDRVNVEIVAKEGLEAMDILQAAASDAAQKHVELLSNADPRVAQGSANAILDRVLQKGDSGVGTKLTEETLALLQLTINELKIVNITQVLPSVERKDVKIAI